ncbi:MAG: hypothetical protein HUJ58_04805, partial [Erysipelotrichaceae bacterium]|nr:hypothetical protein [Erysipelotrichaceae bacterium]
HPQPKQYENYQVTTYYDEPMIFTFRRLETFRQASYQEQSFWFFFVVNGEGTVDNHTVKKGDTWFVPLGHGPVTINGNFDMLVTTYREQ